MALRLYADECVDRRIVAGLRRRGVDVRSAADEALLGVSDERQLSHAIMLDRVVVTNDQDFLRIAHASLENGAFFRGVIFIRAGTRVGDAVRAVAVVAEVLDAAAMVDHIEWVP